ncbi:hypothetical protein ACHHYP_15237 [Achlya hypogyna]|uniref:Uncharacterized protein n=1 Tax=Achlya hypogyna TaxID=1202772 RepID=A0A1V9YBC9_ACHHY|nr:hypothetical protein ACHHYP_15237 [Achlya hypogyna]
MAKQVTFSTTTTYFFDVAYNGSALPKESGPPIGLARKHDTVVIAPLDSTDDSMRRSRLGKFNHLERIGMLQGLYDSRTIALFCCEAIDVRQSRAVSEAEIVYITPRGAPKRLAPSSPPMPKRMRMWAMDYDSEEGDEESEGEDEYIETTYLFGVDYNGSALPKESGPPIGLARTHHTMTVERLDDISPRHNRVRKYDHVDRIQLLKPMYDAKSLALFCYEAIDTRRGRIETAEELALNERRLRARMHKRCGDLMLRPAKRQRMISGMMEYDDDSSEEDDEEEAE